MKTKFLLPHKCKLVGWFIATPAFVFMLFNMHADFMFRFLDYQKKDVTKISLDDGFLFNIQSNNFTK